MNLQHDIKTEGSTVIFSLKGKITSELDYEELEKDVLTYLSKNYFHIIFNLEKLTHTNSSGIGFFMRTLTKSRIMGGDLVLTNITGNVEKIFKLSKLDEVYIICEDQLEGINYFKN